MGEITEPARIHFEKKRKDKNKNAASRIYFGVKLTNMFTKKYNNKDRLMAKYNPETGILIITPFEFGVDKAIELFESNQDTQE